MHVAGGGGGGSWYTNAIGGVFVQASTWINVGDTAQKASFSVDMEQIPGLVEKYKQAQEMLRDILIDATELQQVSHSGAPGSDEVSREMARAVGHKAGTDSGCLMWAVEDGIKRLEDQITQLENAKRDYESSDQTATPRVT